MSIHGGETRLNPVTILFLYDQRRLFGLLAALRHDPLAIMAAIGVLAVLIVGGAWALTHYGAGPSPALAVQLGVAAGGVAGLSLKPLPILRAGPFAELVDDRRAVFVWLWARTVAALAVMMTPIAVAAVLMTWRPGQPALLIAVGVAAGAGLGAGIRLYWPSTSIRLSSIPLPRWRPARHLASRAGRLCWIELSRRERGLPADVWVAAAWLAALMIGMAAVEPRLEAAADAASALLVFLATAQTLRFDAPTVRLLAFEPNSLAVLARDLFGIRLAAAVAAGALVALGSGPIALFGLALGVAFRALEFLHAVRRRTAARLLAQLEIGLVLLIALMAGPVALAWIAGRSVWLYRRADQSMGLA